MFDIVKVLLSSFIDLFPMLIGLDLIFYFVGKLLFGSDVKWYTYQI